MASSRYFPDENVSLTKPLPKHRSLVANTTSFGNDSAVLGQAESVDHALLEGVIERVGLRSCAGVCQT